jgi:hypothetical protein
MRRVTATAAQRRTRKEKIEMAKRIRIEQKKV